jgi:hypothetical protein
VEEKVVRVGIVDTNAFERVHFYLSRLLYLLHLRKLFERKFVLLYNIFLFFNGSAAFLPSSESSPLEEKGW